MLLIERNQALPIFTSLVAALVSCSVAVFAAMRRRKQEGR